MQVEWGEDEDAEEEAHALLPLLRCARYPEDG
jgi:hypothetical protein